MKTEKININKIKTNPKNPRIIKDDKFKKLVKSIKEFPIMLEKRPIIVDENMKILGGNMRYKAIQELGFKETFIEIFSEKDFKKAIEKHFAETGEKVDRAFIEKQIIIKDNVGYGEWDFEMLANEWNTEDLEDWGLDIPNFENYSDKNTEIDVDDFEDIGILKLKYESDKYEKVLELLSEKKEKLGFNTNEDLIFDILKNV